MRRRLALLAASAVALSALGYRWLKPSDEAILRSNVEELARILSRSHAATEPVGGAAQNARVSELVRPQVTLQFAEWGERTEPLRALHELYLSHTEKLKSLAIEPRNLQLEFAADRSTATMTGEVTVRKQSVDGLSTTEPRRLNLRWVRGASGFQIAFIGVTEPRVDQPEARP